MSTGMLADQTYDEDVIATTAIGRSLQGEAQSRFCWSWAGFGPLPQAEDGE